MSGHTPPSATPERTVRYRRVAEELRSRIRRGDFSSGAMLPSEAELSAAYGVSRVTVRSALDLLRSDGLVASRQGVGWSVSAAPLRQSLERLGTIEGMVADARRHGERRILDVSTAAPPPWVASELGESPCLVVTRLNLVDDRPFAVVTVWCPSRFASGLSAARLERATFLEQLPVAVSGATQFIGAGTAGPADAALLEVDDASPVLRVRRITRDSTGESVLVSLQVFPAESTEFVAELSIGSTPAVETTFRFTGPSGDGRSSS